VIQKPPSDWKRPPGRPNHTWLRATESDLRPLNIGPSYTWKVASREHCHSIVDRDYAQEEYAVKKGDKMLRQKKVCCPKPQRHIHLIKCPIRKVLGTVTEYTLRALVAHQRRILIIPVNDVVIIQYHDVALTITALHNTTSPVHALFTLAKIWQPKRKMDR